MRRSPTPSAARASLGASQRIVVKVGSYLLATAGSRIYTRLATQISAARQQGVQCVLVSSGAIALGLTVMGLKRRPRRLGQLQAAAAAGQPELMRRWARALARRGLSAAQVLLTHADLADRERFLNARDALTELLRGDMVPVINENDSVATEEIRVGDNDRLSAQVAHLVGADLVVNLTTVDGVFSADPEKSPSARRIPVVARIDDVATIAGDASSSGLSIGGMRAKVDAARAAAKRSIPVVIARGDQPSVLTRILAGADIGTLFLPAKAVSSRKHWIGFTLRPSGVVHVDAGAARALVGSKTSLLPSGVTGVDGEFPRGAMVEVRGPDGVVARGLTAYAAAELRRLRGCKTTEIVKVLGYVYRPEVIDRDDLLVTVEA
jgi:glutamate 5-kinase